MENAVQQPPARLESPPPSKATIAVCVLAGALGLFIVVHAIASATRELREDERVEVLELDDRSPEELEAERLLRETERLEVEKAQLRRECVELEERLAALSAQAPVMPLIESAVASADGTQAIGLAVGSMDKVEKGFQFSILRDKKFIARVVVLLVGERACACRIVLVKEGETIRVGDAATTNLR